MFWYKMYNFVDELYSTMNQCLWMIIIISLVKEYNLMLVLIVIYV